MSSVVARPLFTSSSWNHLPGVTAHLPASLPGGAPTTHRFSQSPSNDSSKYTSAEAAAARASASTRCMF